MKEENMAALGSVAVTMDTTVNGLEPLVLHISEILMEIFAQGEITCQDLFRCSLVCKQWSTLALEKLWKHYTPEISFLRRLEDCGALAKYIPLMRHLCIRCDSCSNGRSPRGCPETASHRFIERLTELYPEITILSLDVNISFEYVTCHHFRRLLRPQLRRINLPNAKEPPEWFKYLDERYPDLESIHVGPTIHYSNDILNENDRSYRTFISNKPRLHAISCLPFISGSTVLKLSQLRNLEYVSLQDIVSYDWPEAILASINETRPCGAPAPFSRLTHLEIIGGNVTELHIARMLSAGIFTQLRKLKMSCGRPSPNNNLISLLANCRSLTSVELKLYSNELSPPELSFQNALIFFRGCQYLQHFSIHYRTFDKPQAQQVSSADFCTAISALVRIRHLELNWHVPIGICELRAIRDFCPQLTVLNLCDSPLLYQELIAEPDLPVLPKITRFLRCQNTAERPLNLERLILPPSCPMQPSFITKKMQMEIFCNIFPMVYPDLLGKMKLDQQFLERERWRM